MGISTRQVAVGTSPTLLVDATNIAEAVARDTKRQEPSTSATLKSLLKQATRWTRQGNTWIAPEPEVIDVEEIIPTPELN